MFPDGAFPLPSGAALASALLYGVLSSTIPAFNSEIYVVAAAALLPRATQPVLVLCFTIGTLIGTTGLYVGADRLLRGAPAKVTKRVDKWVDQVEQHRRWIWVLLFASAFGGIPPFYAISLAAGMLRIGFPVFFALGAAGRLLRFSAITWAAGGLAWLLR